MFTFVFSNGGGIHAECRNFGEAIKLAKLIAIRNHTTVVSVTAAGE